MTDLQYLLSDCGIIETTINMGKVPDDKLLAKVLRSNESLSPEIRNYLADRVEGKLQKKRGRNKISTKEQMRLIQIITRIEAIHQRTGYKITGLFQKFADKEGISSEKISKFYYDFRK